MINKKRLYGDNKALTPSAWLSLLLFSLQAKLHQQHELQTNIEWKEHLDKD